jgi:hypothetical protein
MFNMQRHQDGRPDLSSVTRLKIEDLFVMTARSRVLNSLRVGFPQIGPRFHA